MYQSISGFPECSPAEQLAFNRCVRIITKHFERVGAIPLETAIVERVSTISGKSSNEKEIYALRRLAAAEGEKEQVDLALRFDLTVPMVRYIAEHSHDLHFPFRRYQIQPVWRGERAQKGRYRQFLQCDIDVVGSEQLSLLNDAEIPVIIAGIFDELGVKDFIISLNNRRILNGLFAGLRLDAAVAGEVFKVIDALDKVGHETTKQRLGALNLTAEQASALLDFFLAKHTTNEALHRLEANSYNAEYAQGVRELAQVVEYLRALGLEEEKFAIHLAIARGLDYYTGTVYETHVSGHSGMGSICSGGRYDHLLQTLGAKKPMPGVGMSIGLTRLFPFLLENGALQLPAATTAEVLVCTFEQRFLPQYLAIAAQIRGCGVNCEVYSEPKNLTKQLKYAHKRGFAYAVIAGEDEFAQGRVKLRSLHQKNEQSIAINQIGQHLHKLLTS